MDPKINRNRTGKTTKMAIFESRAPIPGNGAGLSWNEPEVKLFLLSLTQDRSFRSPLSSFWLEPVVLKNYQALLFFGDERMVKPDVRLVELFKVSAFSGLFFGHSFIFCKMYLK